MITLTEDVVELATLEILHELGHEISYGPDISPDGNFSEREPTQTLFSKIGRKIQKIKDFFMYHNKSIDVIKVIEELMELAGKMRKARGRGEELNLTEYEVAFYDALEVNDSAVKVLGDETLREIAIELAKTIRNNITIDWTLRENVQAKLRVAVKKILRAYGYPPDKQKKAVDTVLEQANLICRNWAEEIGK